MAAMLVGIVYDPATRVALRLVVPHDDASLDLHCGPGEKMVKKSRAEHESFTNDQAREHLDWVKRSVPVED